MSKSLDNTKINRSVDLTNFLKLPIIWVEKDLGKVSCFNYYIKYASSPLSTVRVNLYLHYIHEFSIFLPFVMISFSLLILTFVIVEFSVKIQADLQSLSDHQYRHQYWTVTKSINVRPRWLIGGLATVVSSIPWSLSKLTCLLCTIAWFLIFKRGSLNSWLFVANYV